MIRRDAALAFLGVLNAYEVLVDVVCEQAAQRHVLTAQDDDVTLFSALCPLGLETRELLAGIGGLFVIVGEQDHEITRVLHGLVHRPDEARTERDVVVLDEDLVALLRENVGDLAGNGGDRAPTAQEEVVAFIVPAGHRGVHCALQ
jgi:hypothetical protein